MPNVNNSYISNRNRQRAQANAIVPYDASANYIPPMPGGMDTITGVADAANAAGGLGGMFANLKNWGAKAAPNAKAEFGKFFGGKGGSLGLSMAPEGFDWSSKTGLKAFGKNIGKAAPWISGGLSVLDMASDLSDYANVQADNDKLMSQIQASAMSNPLLSSYLTSDQMNLLNQIRRGGYSDDAGLDDVLGGVVKGLPSTLLSTGIGALTGGIPGAIVGGVGGLLTSGTGALAGASSQNTAELQSLYQALQDAEAQYRSMKRPNFTGLGIQQQYQNMYA